MTEILDIAHLNARFGIDGQLQFEAGPGGLPLALISNRHAATQVVLLGGQVLAFQPHGSAPVLWASRQSQYLIGKAIRGGVPICWPWFGPHPSDSAKPNHGLVRTRLWQVRSTEALGDGATRLVLGITDDAATRALWPHPFDLEVRVTVATALSIELVARNTGAEAFVCTGALHSYFTVGDAAALQIDGLDGRDYLDKAASGQRATQRGQVTIAAETDRIYLDTTGDCLIHDPAMGRTIRVSKSGSRTTVVWNPWVEKARAFSDMADDEYTGMVCVETANANEDEITIAPGGEHRLSAAVGLEA
ncbi:MAG: D-hexose-6-phosphate mutarotase [Roseiflexaceae bacterium]